MAINIDPSTREGIKNAYIEVLREEEYQNICKEIHEKTFKEWNETGRYEFRKNFK